MVWPPVESPPGPRALSCRRQPVKTIDVPEQDQFVFTTMRYDCNGKKNKLDPFVCKDAKAAYLIKYHFDRLRDAAGHQGWFDAQKALKKPVEFFDRINYEVGIYKKENKVKGPFRVRVKLRYHGNLHIDISPIISPHSKPLLYPPTFETFKNTHEASRSSKIFKVVLDALPSARNVHTKNKTQYRAPYEYARLIAGIESFNDAKEVLLFNSDGEIMDGSITTPYFFRNGRWVTPQNSCGCQLGTTRRWAIDQGLCSLDIIKADSIRNDEVIWLSNSVKGFFTARFIAVPGRCSPPNYRSSSLSSSETAVETPTSEYSPKCL